jgi:dethiobiotin synthetase
MTRRVLFIAGSHTDIGKTHVACALIEAARQEGWRVDALKPVVSGFDPADWAASDPGRLLAALGWRASEEALETISPWRYRAPLAPPMAARHEGAPLRFEAVLAFCRRRIGKSDADLMVVEGVGGLMSPIADGATSLDLLESLASWNVLVGGSYLGGVSHTLTALEILRMRGMAPAVLVVSESADPDAPDFMEGLELLSSHVGQTPVIPASRAAGYAFGGLALKAVFA